MFSSEFCETFKNTSFIEHLWATASGCQALLEFRIPSPAWCFSVISENMHPTPNSTLLQNNLKYRHDFSKHLMFMYTFKSINQEKKIVPYLFLYKLDLKLLMIAFPKTCRIVLIFLFFYFLFFLFFGFLFLSPSCLRLTTLFGLFRQFLYHL